MGANDRARIANSVLLQRYGQRAGNTEPNQPQAPYVPAPRSTTESGGEVSIEMGAQGSSQGDMEEVEHEQQYKPGSKGGYHKVRESEIR